MADVERTVGIRIEVTEAGKTQAANEHLEAMNKHLEAISANTKKVGKGVKDESDKMAAGFKSVEAQASALPGPIGNVANALGSVRDGVSAFGKGLGTLRGAIMSTGIGALAIALGSLAAYFTESEEGAQKLRVILAWFRGLTEVLVDRFEGLGKTMVKAFEDPVPAIKEAGKAMFDFLIMPGVAIGKLASDVKETTKAFTELEKRLNSLKVAERELTVERAMSNKTIAEARMIADDTTKSINERTEAVKRAATIEEGVAEQEMRLARERLAVLEAQFQSGVKEEEQLDAIASQKARVYELERETLMRQRKLQNELTSLRNEEIAKIKEADAAKKAAAAAEQKRLDELAAQNLAYMDLLFKRFQQGIEQDTAEAAYMRQVTQETEDARIAIIEDAQLREEMTLIAAFERKMATITGQSEYETNLRKALTEKMNYDLTQIEKRYAAEQVKTAEQVRAAKLNAAQAAGNGLISVAKVVSAAMADNAEVSKAIATAEVWINAATATAAAISKAVQSSATPYDMIANIATAVATVAGAIASTVEILNKADIPGGGGGSVGAMPSFSSSAPQVPQVATNVTGLVNTQSAELQPIQAFVVETQMTGTQSNVAQIYSQATFGLGG